ncbi:hypothetical protein PMAYCL1PPCAC_31102 [Pristionchus mayeri]|uniref:4Fe-4S ferredoxin-type domain-containing protein n=1 Tax=Pristionchus mayeri TaxID=1317129 RepID=A0AAN5DF09_9BILA|nr:hypothetical protein PMAYCL1PPCAC_31102 [Pristionchus mayeri]
MLRPFFLSLLFFSLIDASNFLPLGRPLLHCHWEGSGPFCRGICPGDALEVLRAAEPTGQGDSFGRTCLLGTKSLCCPRNKRLY